MSQIEAPAVVVPFSAPTLTGQLVRLEPLTIEHVALLAEAAAENPDCFGPHDVPCDKISMYKWVHTAIELRNDRDPLPYAIRRLEDGKLVGSTRYWHAEFWHNNADNPLSVRHPNAIEVGRTWLSASAQRTGCNTDAKLLMLTHAFEVWDVRRVSMTTDSRDQRSRSAIERLGASLDGVMRAARPCAENKQGDVAVYTILDHEWPSVRARLEQKLVEKTGTVDLTIDMFADLGGYAQFMRETAGH